MTTRHMIPARNYAYYQNGGHPADMGAILNEQLRLAWTQYRNTNPETWYGEMHKQHVQLLCRIRRAGRLGR